MAKTQKYSEDQLLEAVVKYSEVEKKKIKATELAKWCRDNIEGLEEVRDYHFTRPMKVRDEKTGNMVDQKKLCTEKIDEINKSRSLTVSINTNLLLRASNIDAFMEQPDLAKRKMIAETRETVDKLLMRNGYLERENESLRTENKSMKSDIVNMAEQLDALQKEQARLIKQVSYLMKTTDEAARKEMLEKMGVSDGFVDLDTYSNSLQQKLSEVMEINKILRKHLSESGTDKVTHDIREKSNISTYDIMSGIDF